MNNTSNPRARTESLGQALLRSSEQLLQVEAPLDLQAAVMAASAQAMAQRRKSLLMPAHAASPMGLARRVVSAALGLNKQVREVFRSSFSRIFGATLGGASMALAAMLVWLLAPLGTTQSFKDDAASGAHATMAFTALPGIAGDAPHASLHIVPVALPHAQLSRYGLPFDPAQAALVVRAEMLVNAQGQAVAVRFLP